MTLNLFHRENTYFWEEVCYCEVCFLSSSGNIFIYLHFKQQFDRAWPLLVDRQVWFCFLCVLTLEYVGLVPPTSRVFCTCVWWKLNPEPHACKILTTKLCLQRFFFFFGLLFIYFKWGIYLASYLVSKVCVCVCRLKVDTDIGDFFCHYSHFF